MSAELQVCSAEPLGSHTFFLARILHVETNSIRPEFNMIHGHYAAYRRTSQGELPPEDLAPQPVELADNARR